MTQRSLVTALVSSIAVAGLVVWFSFEAGAPGVEHSDDRDPGSAGPDPGSPLDTGERGESTTDDPDGSRSASISGRVLDTGGNGVPGIRVLRARLSRGGEAPSAPDAPAGVVSGAGGRFSIPGLSAGEYKLEAVGDGYAPTRRNVMAPSSSVTLVVHEARALVLSGEVTDSSGQALEGAEVSTAPGETSRTGADGRYRLAVKVTRAPGSFLALAAKKPGYADQHKTVPFAGSPDGTELSVSFRLEKIEDVARLSGFLADIEGNVVVGESLHLDSPSRGLRFQARSIDDGTFVFENVRAGDDYRLRVYPTGHYRDRTIEPVEISPGPNEIDVTLEPFQSGVLNGVLVDASGAPLPDFSLTLRSEEVRAYSLSVTSDAGGRFRATGVPTGKLVVETRALPKVTVRGLTLGAHQELTAEIPIGVGDRTISGIVSLPGGSPAVGARVVVAWTRREKPVQSTLYTESLTDARGRFSVTGFGPGACSVSLTATGMEPLRTSIGIPAEGDPDPLDLEMR